MKTLSYPSFVVLLLALPFALPCSAAEEKKATKPFKGKVHAIPGLIEAEHYDEGEAGAAYHDVDEENRGADYREKTQVDIEKRDDASNGHGIGWTKEGEWVVYTVDVKEAGTYRIEIPVASKKKGGEFHIELNGVDVTGAISVPDTGSWQQLRLITHENVKIEKEGRQLMKVLMKTEGPSGSIADIDYYKFVKVSP